MLFLPLKIFWSFEEIDRKSKTSCWSCRDPFHVPVHPTELREYPWQHAIEMFLYNVRRRYDDVISVFNHITFHIPISIEKFVFPREKNRVFNTSCLPFGSSRINIESRARLYVNINAIFNSENRLILCLSYFHLQTGWDRSSVLFAVNSTVSSIDNHLKSIEIIWKLIRNAAMF